MFHGISPQTKKTPKTLIITNKTIFKKIVYYSIPFILIDVFKSIYNYVDMVVVVKGLVNYAKFKVGDAEVIYSMLSTWSAKFNMIILSVSTGVVVSLIPNLTESVVKKDKDAINKKINQALNILLFLTVPMTLGISFLAKPVWTIFYGASKYGPSVYSLYVFVALATTMFTVTITTTQMMKEYRQVFKSLIAGFLTNVILNIPLLYAFDKIGLPAYFGSTLATILGYSVCATMNLYFLKKKYSINYEVTIKRVITIISTVLIMAITLLLLKYIIPFNTTSRILNIGIVLIYTLVGALVYLGLNLKNNLIKDIYGNKLLDKLKLRRKA